MTSIDQTRSALPTAAIVPGYSVVRALKEIVQEVSSSRELTYQLTLREFRLRYKQAVFGVVWAALMPGLIVLSGLVIRFAISRVTGDPFHMKMAASLAVKGLGWGYFIGAIGLATPTLILNNNLVTKVYFPREVLPLAAILAQAVDSSMAGILLLLLSPFLDIGVSVNLLWLPVLIGLLICLTLAAGLLLSCANAFFRDVKYLVQMFITFGIFYTPIFYEPSALGPVGAKLIMLNPITPILEGLRLAVVEHHNLFTPLTTSAAAGPIVVWEPWYLLYSAAVAIVGLVVSALIFHHAEALYAEYV
jgi:ABC-type polysaccharide/polyol phosphate export permease